MFRALVRLHVPALIVFCSLTVALCGCNLDRFVSDSASAQAAGSQNASAPAYKPLSERMSEEDKDVEIVQEVVPSETRLENDYPVKKMTAIADLKPAESGPGLVVCEPQAIEGDRGLTDFGAGCARWLQLVVAGQPNCGRTPTWSSLGRAVHELQTKNLGLDIHQASKLRAILGATCVAVGSISGTPSRCALTYQLYDLNKLRPIGSKVSASGPEETVLNDLPKIARTMSLSLGIKPALVPLSVNVKPSEMSFLGHVVQQSYSGELDRSTVDALAKLAPRNPVAGMLYLSAVASHNETLTETASQRLFAQLPGNPIPFAELGQTDPIDLLSYKALAESDFHRFPHNSLFASTDVWLHREDFDAQAERTAAEQLIRDAPMSADAWVTFAATASNEADSVRSGRWVALISPSEESFLDNRYAEWFVACSIATRLDPTHALAWLRLSTAASFYGDDDVADRAFWRAVHLNPSSSEVYYWGLQMYQPKWFADSTKLQRVATLAASKSYPNAASEVDVYDDLNDAGCMDAASDFLERYETALRAKIAAHPNDGHAHWNLAFCYAHEKLYPQAIHEYNAAVRLLPSETELYIELGEVYGDSNQPDQAISAYEHVLLLDPSNKAAHSDLAYEYESENNLSAADEQHKEALRLSPYSGYDHFCLGGRDLSENKPKLAIDEFSQALRYGYRDEDVYLQLTTAFDATNQYDKAIQISYQGLLSDPENLPLLNGLTAELCGAHNYDQSIVVGTAALQVLPNDAYIHEILAECYRQKGDNANADKEDQEAHQLIKPNPQAETQSAQVQQK